MVFFWYILRRSRAASMTWRSSAVCPDQGYPPVRQIPPGYAGAFGLPGVPQSSCAAGERGRRDPYRHYEAPEAISDFGWMGLLWKRI
jgi:hypothetical protein